MTDRHCGYCRYQGHTRAKCEILQWQKATILTQVPLAKKDLHDKLVRCGFGVGAIVSAIDGWSGDTVECVIPTMNFFSTMQFMSYKKRRRHPAAQGIISTYDLNYSTPDCPANLPYFYKADYLRGHVPYDLRIPTYKMSDMSETLYPLITTTSLTKDGHRPRDSWRDAKLLVPSYDTDITDDDLLNGILLHERITGKDRVFARGIKTW